MKKILITSFLVFSPFSFLYADEHPEARRIAEAEINSEWSEWKGRSPQLAEDTVYFYREKDEPSYIEYRVVCGERGKERCGFLLVTID